LASDEIIQNNINWLLNSDIYIKEGEDKGALYGWKDLTNSFYPFIYSEIVGYAITCFSWIYIEKSNDQALIAARESSLWIRNNMRSNVLTAGKLTKNTKFDLKGDLSNQVYSFDNGMILIGLLNLYKLDKDAENLQASIKMADTLIDKFFDGTKMIAMLDGSLNPSNYGEGKWSTISGSFQAKIALGFSKLFKITQKSIYKEVAYSLCDFALTKQNPDGRFKTNVEEDLTFLHPHLYSCEGLLYTGLDLAEDRYIEAAMKGLEWAIKQMDINHGSLPRTTKENVEQSDCMAQLMRLLIICYDELKKRNNFNIAVIIEKIYKSLASLFIPDGEGEGGIKYQKSSNQICTWCTMFTLQAFSFFDGLKETNKMSMTDMMEYYI
jgi:hypothetical protein